jgi:ATP-dependent helicase HrpA
VASRVAQELGVELGAEVGYKIRFNDKTSPDTYVKFVTDGVVLAEMQSDPLLRGYDTIIVDEAHERNLNIDFLLGYLKQLLPKRRDLRVIISSATLETDRFSAYFCNAPVIEVSGRTYPVEVVYQPGDDSAELADRVADAIDEISQLDPRNDVLVFLPGEREIQEAMDALVARALPHTELLPLYGRLPQAEQMRVFQTMAARRIVLATNVAETSLTIPGIVYVVDSGLARVNRYNPRTGITQLLVEPISRASADQRKGRAGRVRSGVCYRLYEQDDYMQRAAFSAPEIQRVGLAGVILQMKALHLGKIEAFTFLDPPSKRAIDEGYRVLEELGALDEQGEPNEIGKKLARLPLDPRLGRMVLAGEKEKSLREVLVLASALSVQDPRERPISAQKQADESHRKFRDEASDFVGMLKLWDWYQDTRNRASKNQVRKQCRDNFVSFVRMKEWSDIHSQLLERCKEMEYRPTDASAKGEAIHRAILAGLLGRIGMWQQEKRSYAGARQIRFALHPSSALSKKPPQWVFAAEIVETSQTFARMAAVLDPNWVEEIAGSLCKRSYQDPHWEERPAHVVAKEQVTLFGLPIAKDRRVHYGPINPELSRKIFLLHALVRQEISSQGEFVEHNRSVLDEARSLRNKARRSDMLVDEDALLPFFDERIPDNIYSGKTFEQWRKSAEFKDPSILKLSLSDVLLDESRDLSKDRFPDSLSLYGTKLELSYLFDPGEDDDGITISIPLTILAQAESDVLEWTIPGWHLEKISLLLHSLPKALRKDIAPIPDVAKEIASAHKPFSCSMLETLARDVHALTGVRVPLDSWRLDELPEHMRFYFRVIGDDGKVLGAGRDLRALKSKFALRAMEVWSKTAKASWEKEGLVSWSFDQIPERIAIQVAGGSAFAYPAVVDEGSSVSLRALSSKAQADKVSRAGVRRLFLLHMGENEGRLERSLPNSLQMATLAAYVASNAKEMREQMVEGVLDTVFELAAPEEVPRTKRAFLARLEAGKLALHARMSQMGALATDVGQTLAKVDSTLRNLAGKPGASRAALDDVRGQLQKLLPKGLFEHSPLERIAHLPRYLRAAQIRLERLTNDPRRDADKALQVVPLCQAYWEKRDLLAKRGVSEQELDAYRWLLEELRVSLFAPEVKTVVPVSSQKVAERWKLLCR